MHTRVQKAEEKEAQCQRDREVELQAASAHAERMHDVLSMNKALAERLEFREGKCECSWRERVVMEV